MREKVTASCDPSDYNRRSLRVLRIAAFACCTLLVTHGGEAFRIPPVMSALMMANEPVWFDNYERPQFTANQTTQTAAATRDGVARWAQTPHGRMLLARLNPREFQVTIVEDPWEEGAGKAPQPGLATLLAAPNHAVMKSYEIILNPMYGNYARAGSIRGMPSSQSDLTSLACAGEMLHVEFYARGISLPHHSRDDFQREWREIANELGFPTVPHGTED